MSTFSVVYNGITIQPGSNYTIEEIEGIFDTPIRTSSNDLTGVDGGNVWAQNFGMKPIAFNGKIFASDYGSFYGAISAFIQAFVFDRENLSRELVISLPNGSVRTIDAKVLVAPKIKLVNTLAGVYTADYSISLICENPFYRDNTLTEYTTGLSQGGGAPIPTPVPAPLGGAGGGSVVVVNNGDEAYYPEIQILGPCLNPVVRNSTLGLQFQINKQILSGEIVTITRTTRGITVTSNIGGNYYQYFIGGLFTIDSGNNTIVFSASGYDANALLTIISGNNYKTPV